MMQVLERHFAHRTDSVAIGWIVLQNSSLGSVQIFSGALECSLENYVGGVHMNSPISNRLPL
jgi:hypothetical protein